jgi:hypothetical protein
MASKQVTYIPFSELNALVVQKLNDHSVYTIGPYCFLKIFEHALTYAALGNDKKLIRNPLGKPIWLQQMRYKLKYIKHGSPKHTVQLNNVVFLDPVRLTSVAQGSFQSIYMDKMVQLVPAENRTIIQKRKEPQLQADCTLNDFPRVYSSMVHREVDMLRAIRQALANAKSCGRFSPMECAHIQSALFIFWEDFRFYYHMLNNQNVKRVVFICHYHNEGMIAACKMLNAETIELQHGLIAANDLYYVYHSQFSKVVDRSFFPDRIWVYGPYWKRVLAQGCEFRPEQVHVAGDYLTRKPTAQGKPVAKENMILLCAQKLMHAEYLDYAERLSRFIQDYPDWRVVVKMHPLEPRKDLYQAVLKMGFELVDMQYTLDELLQRARIQISIYSTTFFDAVGFDVVNFSIQHFGNYQDYAADIVKEAVAFPLALDENPITAYLRDGAARYAMQREEIYAPFQEEYLRAALNA